MFVVEVNGKPQLSTPTLERAKLLAQSFLRDGNSVRIRPHDATGGQVGYFYDPLAVAWMQFEIQEGANSQHGWRSQPPG